MMAGGRVLISATWFQTRLTRVISFQSLDSGVDPFGRSSGYRTADGRTTRGVEISARLHPRRATEISLAYTGADAPPPAGDRDGLPRAAAISTHQFSAWITQRAGALDLSFELEAAGDHFATLFDPIGFGSRAYRFSAFAKADVAVSYRPPVRPTGVSLFGVVENVFDRSYFVQGFRGAGRVGRAGLRVKW
jgi:hypothetical protein